MSYKTNLELAYHMGYEDALARKMPDADKVAVLLPDVADGVGEYITATDGHEGHWLTGEEIVRCRDCEHIHEHDLSAYYGDHEHDHYSCCRLLEPGAISVEPDGFCSWGVRKEDDR